MEAVLIHLPNRDTTSRLGGAITCADVRNAGILHQLSVMTALVAFDQLEAGTKYRSFEAIDSWTGVQNGKLRRTQRTHHSHS